MSDVCTLRESCPNYCHENGGWRELMLMHKEEFVELLEGHTILRC